MTQPQPWRQKPPGKTKTCECDDEPKKERKPRQPRAVCYRGTFKESAFGLSKVRREQVPC